MTPTAPAADPSAPACCDPSESTAPCVACSPPTAVSTRRTEVARLHAKGLSVPAISRALGRRRHTVHADLRALGLTPHRPPPRGHKRPQNLSPERLAQIAVGAMIARVDGSFAAVEAGVLEELEAMLPDCELDLAPLARSVAIRVVQTALLVWFPDHFEEDPAALRQGKVEVLRRRAAMERRTGRDTEANHWDRAADSIDCKEGLLPVTGRIQRVSQAGLVSLVARLRGGTAVDE